MMSKYIPGAERGTKPKPPSVEGGQTHPAPKKPTPPSVEGGRTHPLPPKAIAEREARAHTLAEKAKQKAIAEREAETAKARELERDGAPESKFKHPSYMEPKPKPLAPSLKTHPKDLPPENRREAIEKAKRRVAEVKRKTIETKYIQDIIKEAEQIGERFRSGEARERLDAGLAELTGQQQKKYYDDLRQYNKDMNEYNLEVQRLNAAGEAIERASERLNLKAIEDYNRQMQHLERKAEWLNDLREWADPSNPSAVAIYNREVDKFNREVTSAERLESGAEKAISEIDKLNAKIDKLNTQFDKMKDPTEPQKPPRSIGNVGRELYEAQKQEYQEASRNRAGIEKALAIADVMAKLLVPLYWTKDWGKMGDTEKVINTSIDLIVLIPLARIAAMGVKAASRTGARGVVKAALEREAKLANVTAKELERLLGKNVADSFKDVAWRQQRLFNLTTKLERLKVQQRPTAFIKREITAAEKKLEQTAKRYIEQLQKAERRVITQAERALSQRSMGKEVAKLLPPKRVKRPPPMEIDPVDIVTHTKVAAEATARQVSQKELVKIQNRAAIARFKLLMARDRLPFDAQKYRRLQQNAFRLSAEAARTRAFDIKARYFQLLGVRQRIKETTLTMRNVKAPSTIKQLKKDLKNLYRREAQLEKEAKFGMVYGTAPLTSKMPKDVTKLHKRLIGLREELSELEAKRLRVSKLKPKIKAAQARKDKMLANLQNQLVEKRLQILKLEGKLRKQLNRLIDYQHPKAKGAGGLGVAIETPVKVKPGAPTLTSTATGVGTQVAKKALAATVIEAIGRPLSRTEAKTLREAVLTPDEIRRILIEIEKQQKLGEKMLAKVLPDIEEQQRQREKVEEKIRIKFMEEIERAPKVQAKPAPQLKPKPAIKVPPKPREPIRPPPEEPIKPPPRPIKLRRPIILPDRKGQALTEKELKSAATFKAGIGWWVILADGSTRFIREKPKGATVIDRKGLTPARTIQLIKEGKFPEKTTVDMGIMDIKMTGLTKQPGVGKLKFTRDIGQRTRGDVTLRSRRIGKQFFTPVRGGTLISRRRLRARAKR